MLELSFSPFPTLTTERLILREVRPDDAAALFAMRSDPVVMKHVARPLATSLDEATALIDTMTGSLHTNEAIAWAITLKGDDAMIGTVGFWRIKKEHHRGEVGYMSLPAFWCKGLMNEALSAALDHGFRVLRFHSIEAITDPQNMASMHLLEKNGFVREGWFKQDYFFNGEFLDSAVFSLLCPEARA